MYTNRTNEERKEFVKQTIENTARLIPQIYHPDKFKEYLHIASRFHSYSIGNQLLIHFQKPDATYLAGFQAWKSLDRYVNRGEKGIVVLAPYIYTFKKEVEKLDENGNVVRDKNGKAQTETKELTESGYRTVYVFDISQTSGKELTDISHESVSTPEQAQRLFKAIQSISPASIEFSSADKDSELADGKDGYYSLSENKIVIDENLSDIQKVQELIRGVSYATLHDIGSKDESQENLEADAIACVISDYFGLDTSSYSFDDISDFASDKNNNELKETLKRIQNITHNTIESIEESLNTLKTIEQTKENETPKEPADNVVPGDSKEESQEAPSAEPETPVETEGPIKPMGKKKNDKKLEDFGERLSGSKHGYDKKIKYDLENVDFEAMTDEERMQYINKHNVYPKPNYQEMVDNGTDRLKVFYLKKIYDSLPTKPYISMTDNTPEKIREKQDAYIEFMNMVKNKINSEFWHEGFPDLRGFIEENFATRNGNMYTPHSKYNHLIRSKMLNLFESPDELSLIIDMSFSQFCYSDAEKIFRKFSVNQDYPYLSCSDTNGKVIATIKTSDLIGNADALLKSAAIKYIEEHMDEYSSLIKKPKRQRKPKEKQESKMFENITRTGESVRDGNISTSEFMDEFGFKGGEFGKSLNKKERQESLNFAYDAFKDIATALNIKSEDISLDNKLSIAFGSRGKSGSMAYYQSATKIISLNKMDGAGSLGHEWIHALDNYIGDKLGASGLLSKGNPELYPESLKNLLNTIKYTTVPSEETEFYSFCKLLDGNTGNYWTSNQELLARAGEAYLQDKLAEKGIQNDYLVGNKGAKLPQGEERTAINEAFDSFIKELKEMSLLHEPEKEIPSLDEKLAAAEARVSENKESKAHDDMEL